MTTLQKYGLDFVLLKEPCPGGASAEVCLFGGQVTSWKNELGEEMLFLSKKETFKPPKPIRGGIPICFPQFANVGALERHGFARNVTWSIEPEAPPILSNNGSTVQCGNSTSAVDLILSDTGELWSFKFELRMRVSIKRGGHLTQTFRVRNVDTKPFSFNVALGTYLIVSDVNEVRIEGLETLHFLDNLKESQRFTEQNDAITFEEEVDRVYLDTPNKISIVDHKTQRIIVVKKDGLPDAVIWNPWDKKAKALQDFGDDDYLRMVCVEPASIQNAITLKPGEEWKGRQELSQSSSVYWTTTSKTTGEEPDVNA